MSQAWTWKPLGEVCKTGSGGTPLSSRKEFYEGGTIPWLVSGEVAQGNVREAKNFITAAGLENSAAKLFPRDTVLVAMYGATAGQVGILRFEATSNQAVCGILPSEKFVPEFLYYFLLAKKDDLVAQATGNAQPNISQIKIKNTEVPVLPLPKQQRIVALLDEAFAGLATAKANAERNIQNARAIFESHLQSVFSQRGEGWEENTMDLSELCELIVDCEHKTAPVQDEGIPSIRTPNIGKGKLLLDGVNRVSEDIYKAWSRRAEPKPGDLILAREAPAGNVAVIPDGARVCLGQRTVLIRPKADIFDPFFLAYRLLEPKMQEKLLGHSRGATVQHVNMKDIRALNVGPIPPLRTQQEISGAINLISAEGEHLTRLYERKLAALEELKKSLLHQAFNGEL
jgi:type I restriction enzyme S subunit